MNKVYKTEIIDYGYDGEGVARLDNKVVFLPYALKGEEVEFTKVEEKSKFVKGKVYKVSKPSVQRCKAPCPYFESCGGCGFQHTNYAYEVEIKEALLRVQLAKIGYHGIVEIEKSPKEYEYRNKIRLFVGMSGLALKERSSNRLVYVEKCLLVTNRINDAISKINVFIKRNSLQNFFSQVVLRQEGECLLINFIVKANKEIDYQGLQLLIGNCGIYETKSERLIHRTGLKSLKVEEMGLSCEFSPASFHQVNSYLTQSLYEGVIKNIIGDNVVNCYSGAGVLSGVIAKQGKNVVGIELGKSEHEDAEKLKRLNGLDSLTNICGDCAEVLANFKWVADTIIVDPPRAGMDKNVCNAIDQMNCERLVYVSCNSATLVRDIARLKNFNLQKVVLYDIFARTSEYEVLCILNRKD